VRIGLVGGMANAMYCFTRVLRQQGYDAEYVEDEQDAFPMSQPLWEEVPLTLDWRRFGPDPLDVSGWRELAVRSGWHEPGWIVRPAAEPRKHDALRLARAVRWSGRSDVRPLYRYMRALEPVVERLRSYDRLIVCGIRNVETMLSGRPYVFWPHGGDVNIVPFRHETPFERTFARLTRAAIRRAEVAGTHDPTIAARLVELGRRDPIPYLPFLVDVDRYSPGQPESPLAREIGERAAGRRILLLASRQDFYWKGTDRFARAFVATVKAGAPLYLVVSPWGADVEATRALFADAGVLDSVHYLESAVSKPLLRDLFRIAELVVDQFTVTAFGALMLEAMACGAPVLINLDLDAFQSRWPGFVPPPTLRASTEEEIGAVLRAVADDSGELAALARRARSWIEEHHGPEQAQLYVGDGAVVP
jgi:glycosyltransferase involved in cell wall biosynthesis